MRKTTVYLPASLKTRLERLARERGRSEADVIRAALEAYTGREQPPRPALPLFDSRSGDVAGRDEELLAAGFGRD
jgi:hypothetical protein